MPTGCKDHTIISNNERTVDGLKLADGFFQGWIEDVTFGFRDCRKWINYHLAGHTHNLFMITQNKCCAKRSSLLSFLG
jgi:hypothetical protein